MRLEQSRRLAVSVGLGMTPSLGAVLPTAAKAATPPSTLTGETLSGTSTSASNATCTTDSSGNLGITYGVSGTAMGPYPGSFTESGRAILESSTGLVSASATFTLTGASATVTGTKASSNAFGIHTCNIFNGIPEGGLFTTLSYTATIRTPTGNYQDQGTSAIQLEILATTATLTREVHVIAD